MSLAKARSLGITDCISCPRKVRSKFTKLFFPRAIAFCAIISHSRGLLTPITSKPLDRVHSVSTLSIQQQDQGTDTPRCRPRRLRAELAGLEHEEEVVEVDEEVPLQQQHHQRQQNNLQPIRHQQQNLPHQHLSLK
jgi:hypothetical protein